MEIQRIIDKTRKNLLESVSEKNLLKIIEENLKRLRKLYPENKNLFTNSDIIFLKSLNNISQKLILFIEICEELPYLTDIFDYYEYIEKLNSIRGDIKDFPICKRVDKEIRELIERYEEIHIKEQQKMGHLLNKKIIQLELNCPLCKEGHKMTIRNGTYGTFWGCSQFPNCTYTKKLSPEEQSYLNT
ncbi:DNA topoisomerase type IA domain-containing protein [Desulfonema limicola]|uniref:DNA topoisomerase type IA domain-containing protein n=1 Tax=Desulfonema limicola TaxID=45656 RepID=A0A975B9G8_9BACT|nr:topoisomerase DNA-binding C4 zinc finger domain-containing protein [Desulfonema limicola]QTA81333.1 DNA topoisomerase type IA domain-containing protein [Desulfonema limicola]